MMETSPTKPKICDPCCTSKGIDRISNLPDDVLHNILSSQSIFDVVQLSVLSKRWEYIWTTMPYLHFDLYGFRSDWIERPCTNVMVDKFKDFINWVLISQTPTKLVRFFLACASMFDNVTISRWIHAVTERNVQHLVLSFWFDEPFELPCCLATCDSLQSLKLQLAGDLLKLPSHLGFRHLKSLHLQDVELSTSCFLSKCHLLEKLTLAHCKFETLDIASTSLIHVTILNYNDDIVESYRDCEVKISCPNLKFLKYQAPLPNDIILEALPKIEVVCIFFTESCLLDFEDDEEAGILVHKIIKEAASTSVLKLCVTSLENLYDMTCRAVVCPVSLYKLKALKLNVRVEGTSMEAMMLLLKYSPNLEVLKLLIDEIDDWDDDWQMDDPDDSIVCLESRLRSIQLTSFQGDENERELVRFFLKNARVLEKLSIFWFSDADKSEETSQKIMKFPRTSPHVVVTFLDSKPDPKPRDWHDWS